MAGRRGDRRNKSCVLPGSVAVTVPPGTLFWKVVWYGDSPLVNCVLESAQVEYVAKSYRFHCGTEGVRI